jgi:uncharacterized protein (DUF342 family)
VPGKDTETTATPGPKLELELVNDGMQAVIRKTYPSTTKQEIFVLLQHHQVTFGIQQTRIQQATKQAKNARKPVLEIDFKERNLFPRVEHDMLLASRLAETPGKPGKTVRGDEIPVDEPLEAELCAGDNVRLEGEDNEQQLYAVTDGGASVHIETTQSIKRYTVSIYPIALISSDVGYETGHIDFAGSVLIEGSVTRGFRVVASGEVAISGSVEAGVEIKAGNNVTVQQGIVGSTTRIEAGGSVTAKFIQEARVQAATDVLVGSYIHGAQVRAGNQIQVEGLGGSGGGIVGGESWAVNRISSRNIGSEGNASTHIFGRHRPRVDCPTRQDQDNHRPGRGYFTETPEECRSGKSRPRCAASSDCSAAATEGAYLEPYYKSAKDYSDAP